MHLTQILPAKLIFYGTILKSVAYVVFICKPAGEITITNFIPDSSN